MMKKIIFLIIVLLLAGGGFFYWWQNQSDVRELNKTLPEGVKVAKSFVGDEYKVVNKIDGYEFKVPEEWEGIDIIIYKNLTNDELGYRNELKEELKKIIIYESALGIQDPKQYQIELRNLKVNQDMDMKNFVNDFASTYIPETKIMKIASNIDEMTINNFEVLKLYNIGKTSYGSELVLSPIYYFFKKGSVIYILTHSFDDEEVIKEIILNGKW